MKLLLDTHAAIWWLTGDERFGEAAARELADDSNPLLLSAVVVWEVAIKRSLGKLDVPDGFDRELLDSGARALPIAIEHAAAVEGLPWHHRDPFDRLLVAQAAAERATIVSRDPALEPYGVALLW